MTVALPHHAQPHNRTHTGGTVATDTAIDRFTAAVERANRARQETDKHAIAPATIAAQRLAGELGYDALPDGTLERLTALFDETGTIWEAQLAKANVFIAFIGEISGAA